MSELKSKKEKVKRSRSVKKNKKINLIKHEFPIVGIGASAGGLESFEKFFRSMPSNSGAAFILVSHLDPTKISILPDLIKNYTDMTVSAIEDGTTIIPNNIFVVPPNKELGIMNGSLVLSEPMNPHFHRLPIDYFFRALAKDQGRNAICIIFSGAGSDGSVGLREIKGELGMVMVQEPNTAKYDSMPKSAISTGFVDYILPPDLMPEALIKYIEHKVYKIEKKVEQNIEKMPNLLQKIFLILRTRTGHDFSKYKTNTILRRIERRMTLNQIDELSNYVKFLQQKTEEVDMLFKELLIGVTNFFRDPKAFSALKEKTLPKFLKKLPLDHTFRAWVPGCSTGEEAYSLAIIFKECFEKLKINYKLQIFASDIDEDAINVARAGIYPTSIATDVTPERLNRYFTKENNSYKIKKEIRELIIFASHDVITDTPFTKLDLVSCRNLLIYLTTESQNNLIPIFHYSLNPNGILFLGTSETISKHVDLFLTDNKKWNIYNKKILRSDQDMLIKFPSLIPKYGDLDTEIKNQPGPAREPPISQIVDKLLLENFAPPSVIIDSKGNIIYIHGHTGKYLEPAAGKANLNIFKMARQGLKMQLPLAVRKAVRQKEKIIFENLNVKTDGDFQNIDLTIKPFTSPKTMKNLLLVVFEDIVIPRSSKTYSEINTISDKDQRILELEQEIRYTKENLQSTIEELETSNEEIRSTNEELQSTNEELQSTNEELETSKEELQSLNEELETVNAEFQSRIKELSATSNDFKNLLNNIDVGTIFVDNELRIRRFTSKVTEIFNLIEKDVGRSLADISTNLKYESLIDDINNVLETLIFKEIEIESKESVWYNLRILPYKTMDNKIDGAVIILTDITKIKMTNEIIEEEREYAENIVDTIREPLIILNGDLTIKTANHAFYKLFKLKNKNIESRDFLKMGNGQWNIPQLRDLLVSILPNKTSFSDYKVEHEFPKIGRRVIMLNAKQMKMGKGKEKLILLAMEDITEK